MDIKEFIVATIGQISEAIVELNGDHSTSRLYVNPAVVRPSESNGGKGRASTVEFDICVGVNQSAQAGGALKLQVVGVAFDGKKAKEAVATTTSRLRFSLPVYFPSSD